MLLQGLRFSTNHFSSNSASGTKLSLLVVIPPCLPRTCAEFATQISRYFSALLQPRETDSDIVSPSRIHGVGGGLVVAFFIL